MSAHREIDAAHALLTTAQRPAVMAGAMLSVAVRALVELYTREAVIGVLVAQARRVLDQRDTEHEAGHA